MSQSIKAILQAVLWFAVMVSVTLLFVGNGAWRLARFPLVPAAVSGLILFWNSRRLDRIPDLLKNTFGRYFEKDGLAFLPHLEVDSDGALWISVHYQNQWDRKCRGAVVLQTRSPKAGKGSTTQFGFDIDAEGAEVGVYALPWTPQRDWAGKAVDFAIGADSGYPNGKGRILRRSNGMEVGSIERGFENVATAIALLGGHLMLHKPASVTFTLPTEWATVAETREPTKKVLSVYHWSVNPDAGQWTRRS